MMSFTNFDEIYDICCGIDEIYDICCGMMEEEGVLLKKATPVERLELMNGRLPDGGLWWEKALREIEKEREIFYV